VRRSLQFALAACALVLASCVSPEELRREDEATCTGYGFHAGTDAFAACLQRESLARRYAIPPALAPYWGYGGYWDRWWGPYWP
jgi:starvation-inducible outer membrane lipoprotein